MFEVLEREERKKAESLFKEIMGEDFSNFWRNLDIQVHEANVSPHNLNLKWSSP